MTFRYRGQSSATLLMSDFKNLNLDDMNVDDMADDEIAELAAIQNDQISLPVYGTSEGEEATPSPKTQRAGIGKHRGVPPERQRTHSTTKLLPMVDEERQLV
uniref:Uncharacterized protein n=1 Tax=Pyramimonas obovata TaxID=1411642 RepID=A0A7S0RFV3_9CHLO